MDREFVVEFNDKELGECRTYQKNIMGYEQAIKDLKLYKAKQAKQISDLEAKLAESEKDRLMWQEMYKSADRQNKSICETDIYPLQEENQQLKDKLAESEEKLKLKNEDISKLHTNLQIQGKFKNQADYENKQLKQQLAEHNEYFESLSCKDFNEFKDFISTFMLTPHEEQTLIRELKQQLAEKDEQLKLIKWDYDVVTREYNKLFNTADSVIKRQDQDKISFCVEKLEKVKENLVEDLFDLYRSPCLIYETYGDEYDCVIQDAINNTIDNQIKQLKEGK